MTKLGMRILISLLLAASIAGIAARVTRAQMQSQMQAPAQASAPMQSRAATQAPALPPAYTPPTPQPGPYTLGSDSQPQPGVPQGVVTKYSWTSTIYPGTTRDYWIYVPAQYTASKPACVMIFQDGGSWMNANGAWRAPVVMDNLIAKGEMPVTIGVFIDPGVLPALSPATQQNRFDRSYEYDALGDRYAHFLIDEILPQVAKLYNISSDPNDRALAGASSGGIAAFNAAWNRPDQFRRVMSYIGSFTNLRGGDELASLIRKTEPKPLRVFLQDGTADQNNYSGNWYLGANQIFSALQYAGYESKLVIGTEAHNGKHGGAIFPDAMRWLWKDYPKPVAKSTTSEAVGGTGAFDFLDPASDWQLVGDGYNFADGVSTDKDGNVYFSDRPESKIYKVDLDGKVSVWKDGEAATGTVFGPDGRMYLAEAGLKRIVAIAPDGTESVIATDVNPNDLVVLANNTVYFSDSDNHLVGFIDTQGKERTVYTGNGEFGIIYPNGIRTSPDQSLLWVSDTRSKWVWSFQIQPDGSLADGVPFSRLETWDADSWSGGDGMTVDTMGFIYVTGRPGIQVCDQPGRTELIINKPTDDTLPSASFGGADMQWLYVANRHKVWRRHMMRTGMQPWAVLKPPVPHL